MEGVEVEMKGGQSLILFKWEALTGRGAMTPAGNSGRIISGGGKVEAQSLDRGGGCYTKCNQY